jgi:hypothetical protein
MQSTTQISQQYSKNLNEVGLEWGVMRVVRGVSLHLHIQPGNKVCQWDACVVSWKYIS